MWGRLNAPNHPQPWSGCRPNRRAIVPDVVLASQVEAIRNRKEHHEMDRHVVLAFQIKAIRNLSVNSKIRYIVVLAFQIKAIRNYDKGLFHKKALY